MISVILNVYKRPHMLDRQIEAVLSQTEEVKAENIHVWYNADGPRPSNDKVKTYRSSWNTTFFGRFLIPLLCKTEYIAMFDDDVIPGCRWFENCLTTMKEVNGILGGSGVIVSWDGQRLTKIGWNGLRKEKTEEVDYVGHAWFFRNDWAKYMWYEKPHSWKNGEDMTFSYLAQKYGGIKTYVPRHPESDRELWSTDPKVGLEVGRDNNASWRKAGHTSDRVYIWQEYMNRGWNTLKKK